MITKYKKRYKMTNKYKEKYNNYLSKKWIDWRNELNFPISSKLYKAMNETHQENSSTIQKALNNKQSVLFWSDQHFFHKNIINYSNRPYESMEYMNDKLIQNYKENVKEDDIVVWGGDCSFGHTNIARDYIKSKKLPGYKILILGNHDFEKNTVKYRDLEIFDEILMCDGFKYELDNKEYDIIITHYPIDRSLLSENMLNLHGHIHEKNIGLPYVNMSVEMLNYKPQSIENCFYLAKEHTQKRKNNI